MSNAKNLVQEYFQKRHTSIPKYETLRIAGSDHQPIWQSCVVIDDTTIVGDPHVRKSCAEISVSEKCLTFLSKNKIINKISERSALLVDVENMPNFIDDVLNNISGLDIYAFIGIHHCLSQKTFPEGVIKILSPSSRPDGTDTCMQMYVAILLAQERYDNYFIATHDHYGHSLVDMITYSGLLWKAKNARVVTSVSHIS